MIGSTNDLYDARGGRDVGTKSVLDVNNDTVKESDRLRDDSRDEEIGSSHGPLKWILLPDGWQ